MKILEREGFLKELKGWLGEATTREGRLVFVGGEAGIGKTVLVRTFCQTVEGLALVALGTCDPLSTPRALGPLLDVVGILGTETRRLLEGNAPREQVFRAFLEDIGVSPSLVVFEDVHWADEATFDLLRFLGRRIGTVRATLVATYRDDEVGPKHPLTAVLGDLATAAAVRRMTLPPLSQAAVEILAMGSHVDAAELYRKTGGNPFFVTEILAGGTAQIPPTVRDAVLARASRLSPNAQQVLQACAVIGPRIEPWLLDQVASPVPEAVEEGLSRGILRTEGADLAFRHELGRDAILQSMSPQRALDLHRATLRALRSSPVAHGDPVRLAHHAEAAADHQAVLEYAPAAGRRAARLGAHREAAAQFARALRFADSLPQAERAPLLEAYAEQCWLTDQMEESITADSAAARIWRELGDHVREARAKLRLAGAFVRDGRNAKAEQDSLAALQILEAIGPSKDLAGAYRTRAMLLMMDRQNAEAVTWGEKAIALAERFADAETTIMAYNFVGSALVLSGNSEVGRAYLSRSLTLAEQANLPNLVAWAYWNLGSASGEVYDFATAAPYLTEGIAYCFERDLDTARIYMQSWKALVEMHAGQWEEATRTARSVASRLQTAATSRIMALIALGRVYARRGDPEAKAVLDQALELSLPTGTLQRIAPVRAARAEMAWLGGDHEVAAEEARAAYDLAVGRAHPWFVGELAYWRCLAGDLKMPHDSAAKPFALQMRGEWAAAADEWDRLGCPYEAARALSEAGEEGALRRALEAFERLGARPMAAMAARRLRELGVRSIPRGPRPSTRAHPAGLTSREVEIVRLIADGLRNAEIANRMFLSVKTVDHHVSSVLSKLGIRSRAEVLREATRLGLVGEQSSARQDRRPVSGGSAGCR